MKTKYVCHGPISPPANCFLNRLVVTIILLVKNCRWGGGEEKEPQFLFNISARS